MDSGGSSFQLNDISKDIFFPNGITLVAAPVDQDNLQVQGSIENSQEWSESSNQMKIIDHKNETLGNFTISQEELTAILANKNHSGTVTVHIQGVDGTLNPVQLQIIPEDQLMNAYNQLDSNPQVSEGSASLKSCSVLTSTKANHKQSLFDEKQKTTTVLQLSSADFKNLIKNKNKLKVKSVVFKQIDKGDNSVRNCLTDNPKLRKYIRACPYLDFTKGAVIASRYLPTSKPPSKYKCMFCDRTFSHANNLKRHLSNIHQRGREDNKHDCPDCGKTFSRRDYLNTHIRSVHEKSVVFRCSECRKCFSQKSSLNRHIQTVHLDIKRFKCKYCDYSSAMTNDIKKHAAVVHFKRSRYQCTFCGFRNWSASTLKGHVLKCHSVGETDGDFTCGRCKEVVGCSISQFAAHDHVCKKRDKREYRRRTFRVKEEQEEEEYRATSPPRSDEMIPWEAMIKDEPEDDDETGHVDIPEMSWSEFGRCD